MSHWGGNNYCYGVDGHEDAILSSRPDTLLANGGAFLPSPLSSYTLLPSLVGCPPNLQASSSGGVATAFSSPLRRAMSSGDLLNREREVEQEQRVVAPGRYSTEERRERIDKYRSKRNQRNFQKKITYACRKTLADSRPRVKGRFARNTGDYAEAEADADLHQVVQAAAPSESSEAVQEWWPAAQQEAGILCDDMLAAYLGVSSISLYSPSASTTLPHHHYS